MTVFRRIAGFRRIPTAGTKAIIPLALVIGLIAGPSSLAGADFLQAEYWGELEPFVSPDEGTVNWSREGAVRRLLDFARAAFSGMVYGYEVVYEPPAPARRVQSRQSVTPRHELPWGDTNLSIFQTRETDSRVYANIRYDMNEDQVAYREGFMSSATSRSQGVGTASILGGPEMKQEALEEAIVDAVRRLAQRRHRSRPASISARVLLQEPPSLGFVEGEYRVRVRAMVVLDEVRGYELF